MASREQMREWNENARINTAAYMAKKNVPCMDCGLRWHPACMTLDHRNRDTKYVTSTGVRLQPNKMRTLNPYTFAMMLDYCDAVCSNCHKIREMRRDHTAWLPQWKMFSYALEKGGILKEPSE